MNIKLSFGSASALGLSKARIDISLETIYLMLGNYCSADCKFCAQAKSSKADRKFLSRVTWPEFELKEVLDGIENTKAAKRLCIQTLKYPNLEQELIYLVKEVRKKSNILISACINPLKKEELLMLKEAGANNVGIGLDCATKELFYKLKPGAGKWEDYIIGLKNTIDIFCSATVHLIVGLGESDLDVINMIWKLNDLRVNIALFSYTPLKGIELKLGWPRLERYRAIQLARYLMEERLAKFEDFKFENDKLIGISVEKEVIEREINSGKPFQTSGCKYCTRPFYNERVRGPLYNYPRNLSKDEIEAIKVELRNYGVR